MVIVATDAATVAVISAISSTHSRFLCTTYFKKLVIRSGE